MAEDLEPGTQPPPRPPLIERVMPLQWLALDAVAAVGFLALLSQSRDPGSSDNPALDALALAASLVFLLRRRFPVLVLVFMAVATAKITRGGSGYENYQPFGMMLALYSVVTLRRRWVGVAASAFVLVVAVWVCSSMHMSTSNLVLNTAAVGLGPGLSGYIRLARQKYLAALDAEQAQKTEAEITARIADERMRIARELHDVVAHAVSLMTVQAGVAVYRSHGEEQLRETLSSIESTGRAALVDMRRLLGVLRRVDDEVERQPELAPMPGLGDLGTLVSQTAQAGLRVSLQVTGEQRPSPAGLELAVFRIVQESLTNVMRHARTPSATVVLGYEDEDLTVNVTNPGFPGTPTTPVVPGHGLSGMAERVAMYGGALVAERTPTGGFSVSARIPLVNETLAA
jgi:signal transduction histidine kinase